MGGIICLLRKYYRSSQKRNKGKSTGHKTKEKCNLWVRHRHDDTRIHVFLSFSFYTTKPDKHTEFQKLFHRLTVLQKTGLCETNLVRK